jgi:DNA-binding LacI/PurR family transcriptional regulator
MPRPRKGFSGEGHPKRVTLQDIADVAGVRSMTVSDALNGTRRVAPATRERIVRIAREMNYVPNLTARALATGKTGRIGLLSGQFDYLYYANMLHFLKLHLDAANYKLLLLRNSEEVRELIHATNNTEVDGLITIDMYGFNEEFGEQSSLPCVSIGAYERASTDYVLVDLSAAVEEAVDLMFQSGRQRIAYFVTSKYMAIPEESRARGYFAAMQRIGIEPEIINVESNDLNHAGRRLADYIEEKGCPDGLLCQNDEIAMIAFRVLRDSGRRVPDDVLLVGCDGQLHMNFFDPPLSSIAQPLEETCTTALRFLRQRIANPALPHQTAVLQGSLIVRGSLQASQHS